MKFSREAANTLQASRAKLLMADWFGRHSVAEDDDGYDVHLVTYEGVTYFMGYVYDDTWSDRFRNVLAVVGFMALAALAGMYQAGFFAWWLR